jgi:hypothetical protein
VAHSPQVLVVGRALMSRPKLRMLDEQNALAALSLSGHAHVIDLGGTTLPGTGSELHVDRGGQEAYLGRRRLRLKRQRPSDGPRRGDIPLICVVILSCEWSG